MPTFALPDWKRTEWWRFASGVGNAWFVGCALMQAIIAVPGLINNVAFAALVVPGIPLLMGFVAGWTWRPLRLSDNHEATGVAILAVVGVRTFASLSAELSVALQLSVLAGIFFWLLHLLGCRAAGVP